MDLVDILAGLGPDNLAEKRKALMQWRINSAMGMLAPTTGTGVEAATRMLPMTGEAWTANDAGNAIQEGQYGKAAMMGLLGLLPLGGMMSAGLRAGATVPKRMGQSGAIAWHGSPHKFDKFSLDKIGTGEGAQAYGHGLYLAEAPAVAKEYATKLSSAGLARNTLAQSGGDIDGAIAAASRSVDNYRALLANGGGGDPRRAKSMLNLAEKKLGDLHAMKGGTLDEAGSLYKTDIPDEAVARFLDWDKPLSQQAPEVQAALQNTKNKQLRAMTEYANVPYSEAIGGEAKTMGEAFRLLNLNLHGKSSADSAKASALLAKQGIPGIRYLDGGSRSGGAGTSNFVVFDPELIRILERNGIPTGNQPWKAGEWQGMLSGTK